MDNTEIGIGVKVDLVTQNICNWLVTSESERNKSMIADEQRPWGQLPEENARWYGRFQAWLQLGKSRSVLAIYNAERERKGEKKRALTFPESWGKARIKYRWAERVAAWDKAEQERKDREWKEQREAEREAELKIADELRTKARAMLALPETVEEVKRNRAGEEIAWLLIPEFRAFKAASDMLGQAKNHARAALEMPNQFARQEMTGKDGGPIRTDHVERTPEERLARLIELAQQVQALPPPDDDDE